MLENNPVEELSADEMPCPLEKGTPQTVEETEEPRGEEGGVPPEETPDPDPVMKPKRKVNRSKAQEDGLKKAQEVRKKNIELRKAEKLVAAQELVKDRSKNGPEPVKNLPDANPKPPERDPVGLKDLKDMMEILDLKKRVQASASDDSDDEIERLEKRLERKKSMRRKRQERAEQPTISRNTVNAAPKKMLSFS